MPYGGGDGVLQFGEIYPHIPFRNRGVLHTCVGPHRHSPVDLFFIVCLLCTTNLVVELDHHQVWYPCKVTFNISTILTKTPLMASRAWVVIQRGSSWRGEGEWECTEASETEGRSGSRPGEACLVAGAAPLSQRQEPPPPPQLAPLLPGIPIESEMRLILVGLAVLAGAASAQHQSYSFAPLLPIAPFSVYPGERVSIFQQGGYRDGDSQGRSNACSPSPCGPNTRCEVTENNIARCRCLDGYVTRSNTIDGCKPQCLDDGECPDDHRCRSSKCVRVCEGGACGLNAYCEARNHKPVCKCPPGYRGNPDTQCTRALPEIRAEPPPRDISPCLPNPCGDGADCKEENGRAVCRCPHGFEGNPLTRCTRGECIENRDCPSFKLCRQLKCINPCSDSTLCWANSDCQVKDYQVICTCRPGYEPDGDRGCRRFDPSRLCDKSPCGLNTNCKVKNDRAVCSCLENHIGDPLSECRPECVRHEDCLSSQHCRSNRCTNPCHDACGENAICEVRNHQAICKCPEYYEGDPYTRCRAECFAHDDCLEHQACLKLKCINPCNGACGTGADCKVTKHQPICSCPKGYTGHPFDGCRPFSDEDFCHPSPCGKNSNCEVGTDRNGVKKSVCTCIHGFIGNPLTGCSQGQCISDTDCSTNQACYLFECMNPCVTHTGSVCGEDAICNVRDRKPVCSCPRGYTGDPRERCIPLPHSRSRYSGGRFK